MTSNNLKILPTELYRPGRIDQVLRFTGLSLEKAIQFCIDYSKVFSFDFTDDCVLQINKLQKHDVISHATLVNLVHGLVKSKLMQQGVCND